LDDFRRMLHPHGFNRLGELLLLPLSVLAAAALDAHGRVFPPLPRLVVPTATQPATDDRLQLSCCSQPFPFKMKCPFRLQLAHALPNAPPSDR
jgi:hypothetical protein